MRHDRGLAASPRCGVNWKWRGVGNVVSLVVRRGRPPSSQPSGRRDASASRTRTRSPNKASRSHERARLLAGFAATTSSPSPCLARSFGRPRLSRRAQGRLLFSVHTFDISREPAIVRRFAARWTASDFCRKMSTSRPFARVLLPGGPSTPPHLISRTRARGSEGFASCLVRSIAVVVKTTMPLLTGVF